MDPKEFYSALLDAGIDFFAGVPDSLLKDFCAYLQDHAGKSHIIAANEGNAVALGAGHYLGTGRPGLIYMQNSGLGNAVNPLVSLADEDVYRIPMLLVIGWRGEPGVPDEPQHRKQGKITLPLLGCLGIRYSVLSPDSDFGEELAIALSALSRGEVYAFVVKKGFFESYGLKGLSPDLAVITREAALQRVLENIESDSIIVSTTGKLSRELFEIREHNGEGHEGDFLTVGSMGHCSQIALAIARNQSHRNVYCLDGDGSVIMHMGSLAICGGSGLSSFKHIVFNNASHESVGGQPTAAGKIDIPQIAKSCGYDFVSRAGSLAEIDDALSGIRNSQGPGLIEIRVMKGSRKDLGRPTKSPSEQKDDFMGGL